MANLASIEKQVKDASSFDNKFEESFYVNSTIDANPTLMDTIQHENSKASIVSQ